MITFKDQLEFEHWANAQVLAVMLPAHQSVPQVVSIFAHILSIGNFWAARAGKSTVQLNAWPSYSTSELAIELSRLRTRWLMLSDQNEPSICFFYRSNDGQHFTNSFGDMLQEIFLHGAYHRGQIALLLRLGGFEPPQFTDFIPALRSKAFCRPAAFSSLVQT